MHLRVTDEQRGRIERLAGELDLSEAGTVRRLVAEALAARDRGADGSADTTSSSTEMQLHVLVAVEQVIVLIESFLPKGPGTANRILPEAVLAARRRLEAGDGDPA